MASGDLERGKNISNNNNNRGSYSSGSYYVEPGSDQQWTSWLIPMFVVANVAVFIVAMYINNCPKNNWEGGRGCVARFLGRLSFEPLKENPLFGPSSSTWVSFSRYFLCVVAWIACYVFPFYLPFSDFGFSQWWGFLIRKVRVEIWLMQFDWDSCFVPWNLCCMLLNVYL